MELKPAQRIKFEPRFDGQESLECAALRYELYEKAWSATESKIQVRHAEARKCVPGAEH